MFRRRRHLSTDEALDLFASAWRAARADDELPEISTLTRHMRERDRVPLTMMVAAWIAREVTTHERMAAATVRAPRDNSRGARATPAALVLLTQR